LKVRVPKPIRSALISIFVLIVLSVIAGIVYVLVSDMSSSKPNHPVAKASQDQVSPLPKPVAPGLNAPEGVAVETITSPVTAGSNSSITVSTNAGSACVIAVTYSGVASTDSGLAPKIADAYGNATWTWTVGSSVPVGNWSIRVTCSYHGRTGVSDSNLVVTKS